MALLSFVDTMELMALNFHGDEEEHHRFVHDSKLIIDTLVAQLHELNSLYKDYMGQMRKTASVVSQINMDIPLTFEIFLPMRLPIALTPSFDEPERSVQLSKSNFSHPFFFGNTLNAKCMNMRMQCDLQQAITRLSCIEGYWGSVYDVSYTALCYNRIPFAHQVIAMERGAVERCIRFDFILALEFDGAEMPLPAYYNVPIGYKWLAYGLLPIDASHNAADWGVLVPRWQSADISVRLRSHNMLLLLHRLLYSQGCYCFAVPFLVKFGFFMTTVACGEDYKSISVAGLMITTLGHQVFRNFCELIVMSNAEDHAANIDGTVELREQQVRGKGLFAMLAKGLQLNVISREFIRKYFQIDCIPYVPQPEDYPLQVGDDQLQYEQHELLEPQLQQLLQLQQSQQLQHQLFQQQFPLQEDQLSREQYEQQQQQLLLLLEEQQQLPLYMQQSQRSPCRKRRRSI